MADTTLESMKAFPPGNFWSSLDGEILTVANGAIGNGNTSYTYIPLVKAGFNAFSLQFVITATTLTIEGSNSATSIADGSAVWTDITDVLTDGVASSFTATGSLTVLNRIPWSRLRIKRVTTNATNALRLLLTRMQVR